MEMDASHLKQLQQQEEQLQFAGEQPPADASTHLGAREMVLGEPFLLLHILSFLPAPDLGRATLVCRHFYAVGAQDGERLWRHLLAHDRKLDDWRDVRRRETARAYVANDRLFGKVWRSGALHVVTVSGHKVPTHHLHCLHHALRASSALHAIPISTRAHRAFCRIC
jgi:hypothetical protein